MDYEHYHKKRRKTIHTGWKRVHAGHLETIVVHLICERGVSYFVDDDVFETDAPVTCKKCLAILEKRGRSEE
jgi:hypothetical protein